MAWDTSLEVFFPTPARKGYADFTGSTTVEADGTINAIASGAAALAGSTTLSAEGTAETLAAAALAGSTTLSADGHVTESVPVDILVTFDGMTEDAALSPAMVQSAAIVADPSKAGTWRHYDVTDVNTPLDHTFVRAANYERRTPVSVNGTTYRDAAGTRLIEFLHEGVGWGAGPDFDPTELDVLRWTAPAGIGQNLSITSLAQFNADVDGSPQDTNIDHLTVYSGLHWMVATQHRDMLDTRNTIQAHASVDEGPSNKGRRIPVVPGVTYSVTLRANNEEGRAEVVVVNNETGELVGSSWCPGSGIGSTPTFALIQDYLRFYGGASRHSLIAIDFTNAALPLESIIVPAPTSLVVAQSNIDEVTLTWNSRAMFFDIERRADGGAWASVATDVSDWTITLTTDDTFSWVDDTVVDGVTYEYRITAKVGDWSSVATFDPIAVDNDAFVPPTPEVLHWPLNDGSGTTITAAVGVNGTTDAGWSASTHSGTGAALDLDGTSQKSYGDANTVFGTDKITASLWVNADSWPGGADGTYRVLLANRDQTNPVAGISFIVYARFNALIVGLGKSFAQRLWSFAVPTAGEWHNIVIEMDTNTADTAGSVQLWVDGVLQSGTPSGSATLDGNIPDSVLRVGGMSAVGYFPGLIDDVRIYNRSLTSQELAALAAVSE